MRGKGSGGSDAATILFDKSAVGEQVVNTGGREKKAGKGSGEKLLRQVRDYCARVFIDALVEQEVIESVLALLAGGEEAAPGQRGAAKEWERLKKAALRQLCQFLDFLEVFSSNPVVGVEFERSFVIGLRFVIVFLFVIDVPTH